MMVTGNSLRLVKDIREALGQLSGSRAYAPGNLGVALSAGKHQRTPLARAIRKKRFRISRARTKRLAFLKVSRRIRARLFKSGCFSAVSYGMEVQGVAPTEILHIKEGLCQGL
eukprot:4171642-Pyramimonas_sp.AAC.1